MATANIIFVVVIVKRSSCSDPWWEKQLWRKWKIVFQEALLFPNGHALGLFYSLKPHRAYGETESPEWELTVTSFLG